MELLPSYLVTDRQMAQTGPGLWTLLRGLQGDALGLLEGPEGFLFLSHSKENSTFFRCVRCVPGKNWYESEFH